MSAARALPDPPSCLLPVATALGLDARDARLLWRFAETHLDPAARRSPAILRALLSTVEPLSPLRRLGVLRSATAHGERTVRVAPDVLHALQGQVPRLPHPVRQISRLLPWGEAWSPPAQTRLRAGLAALQSGACRWVAIPSGWGDGVLDAVAATRPTIAIAADRVPRDDRSAALNAVLRHARLRRLWPLIVARGESWPAVRRWATRAMGPFVVAIARDVIPPTDAHVVRAQSLGISARQAIWQQEVDPAAARWLAPRYPVGRAVIQRAVDALRLRGDPLCIETLTPQLARLRGVI